MRATPVNMAPHAPAGTLGNVPAVDLAMATVDPTPMWLTLLHWTVVGLYVAAPVGLIVLATVRRKWRSSAVATFISGIVIGAGLVVAYAYLMTGEFTGLRGMVVLVTAWLAVGLLTVLKIIDLGIQFLTTSLATKLAEGRSRYPRRSIFAVGRGVRLVLTIMIGMPILASAAMVYRPAIVAPTAGAGPSTTVRFETSDGLTIAGLFLPAPPRSPGGRAVVVIPGLGSGKSDALPAAETIRLAGYDVLVIDPRAHGESDGRITSFGDREQLDVLAAAAWLRAETSEATAIHALGISMGGAATLGAAADGAGFASVGIIDSFDDFPALVDTLVTRQFRFTPPLRWFTRTVAVPLLSVHSGRALWRHVPASDVEAVWPTPVMIVHSFQDEIIPFVHGQSLFNSAAEPKRSFWLESETHAETTSAPAALEAIILFFKAVEDSPPVV